MYVFYSKIDELREVRARSPFVALLGMSLMMVSELPAQGCREGWGWVHLAGTRRPCVCVL